MARANTPAAGPGAGRLARPAARGPGELLAEEGVVISVDSHICIDREEAVVPHVSHGDLTTKHET